jgi:hypothetical protein
MQYSGFSNSSSVNADVCIPYATTKAIMIDFGAVQNLQATPLSGFSNVIGTGSSSIISIPFSYTSPVCVLKVDYDLPCGRITQSIAIYNTCYTQPLGTFSVYPNPANNTLKISNEITSSATQVNADLPLDMPTTSTNFEVKLFDDKAKLVLNDDNLSESKEVILDTQKIPNGTYYLHITQGKDIIKKQIIIQHNTMQ